MHIIMYLFYVIGCQKMCSIIQCITDLLWQKQRLIRRMQEPSRRNGLVCSSNNREDGGANCFHFGTFTTLIKIVTLTHHLQKPSWRNGLVCSAANREVGGSSPLEGKFISFCNIHHLDKNSYFSNCLQEPSWRNWLARSAINREVGGSSPHKDEFFSFCNIHHLDKNNYFNKSSAVAFVAQWVSAFGC